MEDGNKKSYIDWRKNQREKVNSGLTHECGIFGVILNEDDESITDVAELIVVGLESLQHRGQESAGIVTTNGTNTFNLHKGMGLVRNIFKEDNVKKLKGMMGIGHTRYSTSCTSDQVNCQPFVVHSMHGSLAVAHNGELVNCGSIRKQVLDRGVGLSTHSDSELITQALCLIPPDGEVNGPDWPARIKHLMQLAPLSYSLLIMLKDRVYAVRDPFGNRPLCLGEVKSVKDQTEGWVVSSETCAFLHPIKFLREVNPGEIIEITKNGIRTVDVVGGHKKAFCIFEYVYFAKPNSIFEGQDVYSVRLRSGRQLAKEHFVAADIVGSVPESGNAAAHGYSQQSKIPFGELLTKNNYVGRTFIQPSNRLRQLNIALKFSPIMSNVRGKRVILIDDSIVRGNTIGQIIKLLRKAGAKEVHIRVASPPLKHPCYMGINIPTKEELIANSCDSLTLAKEVGADTLEYLSVSGLVKAVENEDEDEKNTRKGHCTACLTGYYPGGLPEELNW